MRGRRGTLGTPKKGNWKPAFLQALRDTGVVRHACETAKVPYRTAYRHREQEEAFAADWDEALEQAADLMELEARRRAVEGVEKRVYHKGEEIDVVNAVLLEGRENYLAVARLVRAERVERDVVVRDGLRDLALEVGRARVLAVHLLDLRLNRQLIDFHRLGQDVDLFFAFDVAHFVQDRRRVD